MAKESRNGSRGQVQYHCEKVEELPPNEFSRGMRYFNLLKPLMEDPGSTYLIATFSTDSGASVVKKALDAGERKIPEGKWIFDTRVGLNDQGEKVSRLYATYAGVE